MPTLRRFVAAPAVAVALLAAAACDAQLVGTAAVVGDERLSIAQLQDEVSEIQGLEGTNPDTLGGPDQIQRTLLTRYVQHQLVLELAEREDIEVTEAEVDDRIAEVSEQVPDGDIDAALAAEGLTEPAYRRLVINEIVVNRFLKDADEQELEDKLNEIGDEIGVQVNPRYGEWSDLRVAAGTGSISTPAPAPTP